MGLYPGSQDSPNKAMIYGPLPSHGFSTVALVLHTTETRGMPSFGNGDTAPHYVYDPTSRVWTMWAEYEWGYVGTLKGHSSGHYNCKAFQVEILGYSDPNHSPWVGDFTEENYADLADFVQWARERYGIGNLVTLTPEGGWRYGVDSIYRLTDDEWAEFTGLTAHGAVPNNTHYDTGVLDLLLISEGGTEMKWADIVADATWAKAWEDGFIDGNPAHMPQYYQANGVGEMAGMATEDEKKNGYNVIMRAQMEATK